MSVAFDTLQFVRHSNKLVQMSKIVTILIVALATSMSSYVSADDSVKELNSYGSINLGYGISTSGGGNNFFAYAARAGTGVYRDKNGILSLGLSLAAVTDSAVISSVAITSRSAILLVEILEREVFGSHFYFGGRFGLGLLSADLTSGSTRISGTGTSFASAPVVGYEFKLDEKFTAGIDASWLGLSGGYLNFAGVAVPYNATTNVLLFTGITYHW